MPLKFQGCISRWGRNQEDGLCLKGTHDVTGVEWQYSQNYRLDICFKMCFTMLHKNNDRFSYGIYSLNKNNKLV